MVQLAPIERLPREIIQDIFLRTLSRELPAASPFIGASLSNAHLYGKLCDEAFPDNPPRRATTEYQNYVFSRRWMTLDFFCRYIARRAGIAHCKCWRLVGSPTAVECGCASPWQVDDPLAQGRLLPWARCSLPAKLTHGPWTDDKVAFLRFLLITTPMGLDRSDQEAVKLAAQGKVDAIMERNRQAAFIFSHVRRLSKPPTLELIKTAIIKANCNMAIVFDLMQSAREWGLRHWDDEELDAWCLAEEEKGNPKGRWVRIKLVELRGGKYPDPKTGNCKEHIKLDVRQTKIWSLKPVKVLQLQILA